MGNLQSSVRGLSRRQRAVQLCQQGWSNDRISEEMGCNRHTVNRYLRTYLETDSRFPVGINASEAQLMRAEQRQFIESAQQKLLSELDGWSKHQTYGIEDRAILADKLCKLSDSLVRTSERLSAMYGLDAPKAAPTPASVTNNTQINIGPIASMIESIKARRAAVSEAACEEVTTLDNGNGRH
jgi:Homeodomain-like domain